MTRLLSPSLSPNVTIKDVWLATKLLFSPWNWYSLKAVLDLTQKFSETVDVSPECVFPVISGRSGISQALSAYNISEGDEVIMQAFNCVAVVNAIQWVKATPIIVDIEQDTLCLSFKQIREHVTPQTKAIILQHTFGLVVPQLEEIVAFAHDNGIMVIEDCAHALGATHHQKSVGTFGDIGIFSFGRDKIISSVFGGIIVVNDPQKVSELRHKITVLQPVNRGWIIKQLFHPIITYVSIVTYTWFGCGKFVHWLFSHTGIISKATSREEKSCGQRPLWTTRAYPGALAVLAMRQLDQLEAMNTRRLEIAHAYAQAGIPCIQPDTSGRVWLRYAVFSERVEQMYAYFLAQHIVLGDWYDQVVAPKQVDLSKTGYQIGSAPHAEEVCAHVVNLPVYQRMSGNDIQRVVSVYDQYRTHYGDKTSN
ncbi:hypothetical protein CO180_04705 [candidate division WWE3 bacterium CG_4_9_14_3_um_filter_41_6]|uniref:Aminotransferase n=1 Tax=candidate division WWE3 bacterium CG_4_10_14_0_2_um_filter_41_14 TaxID=1975072 RepID=A0A2M7TI60_UNCKA|nr:MAG: hypothetical protein COY32_04460 [candidate division WWE3 bacterium CG_4_10_14_0_2_um_filter_41_14]PJA37883.1 MAG: hypothetical protein CO180_04705 [candidate division WWE3 bacterium CG_4_9_14_3_um_filter_41_6]